MTQFLNRDRELETLRSLDARSGPQFVAVFGRRRIGKTALLTHWLTHDGGKRGVYWVAHRGTSAALLAKFSQALRPLLNTRDPGFTFSSWHAALEHVAELASQEPLVLVLDELPYLLESVPSFATILQEVWDHALKRSHVRLVAAGSHYHMMHETFTSQRGALFGRATATLFVDELDLDGIALFLPGYSPEQLVETYSVVGGVPTYLEMWSDRQPVLRNVKDVLLAPETIFRNESSFLIQDEIADPRTYLAILEAIGGGAQRPVDIAKTAGVQPAHVGKYLHTLEALRFTRRVVSAEASARRSTRQSKYEIRDPYLRFHFAFVQPNLRLLEQQRLDRIMELVRAGFDAHVGRVGYEELCRRYLAELADRHELPFEALEVGRMWEQRVEIDIAALDQAARVALVAECRWRKKKMADTDLDALKGRAAQLSKLKGFKQHYALFSRAGFTEGLRKRAARERVLLIEGVPPVERRGG